MGVFSFNFRDIFELKDLDSKEYEFICYEFNKIANSYAIKTDLYSTKVWEYISEKFDIKDESNVLTFTEIEMDEKNKKHKLYKYIVKCDITYEHIGGTKVYLVFNDELRGYDDTDYLDYVTEEDKSNKISALSIYYDCQQIPTKTIEETFVKDLLECAYLPSTKNQFFTIATNKSGFVLKPSYVKEMDIDLELNYGSKFLPIYDTIIDKLKNERRGLFLLHGEPGTGKCVDGETFVTLRDKTTGEVMEISIDCFYSMMIKNMLFM